MRWEYASLMVASAPVNNELTFTVIALNEHPWDYEREPMSPDMALNQMGAEGWELVSLISIGESEGIDAMAWRYTLKRPRD